MEKYIKSYENLWNKILEIEKFSSKVIFFDNILLEPEYNQIKSYEILWDMESRINILNDNSVEKDRIYISDYLYKMFFTYRAILLRCHLMYYDWIKKWNIIKFNKDPWVISLLRNYLNEEEVDIALNKKFWWLSYINGLFKRKFLEKIKKEKDILQKDSKNIFTNNGVINNSNSNFSWINNWEQKISNNNKSWQDNKILFILISIIIGIIILILGEYIKNFFFK